MTCFKRTMMNSLSSGLVHNNIIILNSATRLPPSYLLVFLSASAGEVYIWAPL